MRLYLKETTIRTIIDPKELVYDLLVKLCHVSTWEGVTKHEARAVLEGYAELIDEIYKEVITK